METSKVYFLQLNDLARLSEVLPEFESPLAVKTHFGEEGNKTYLPPETVRTVCEMVKEPTLIETGTLYTGPRARAGSHIELAKRHGFDFAPIDIIDGESGNEVEAYEVNGKHFNQCYLGVGLKNYPAMLVVSHFKGHILSRYGGALKNLAMGLAGRRGKLAQHQSIKHYVDKDKCIGCGICVSNCPENAISYDEEGKAVIDEAACISCSECKTVCPQDAVYIPVEQTESRTLQERIAEYAAAAAQGRQCFYVNILVNITHGCDCQGMEMQPLTQDIGILASDDPVALDQASYDMVVKQHPDFAAPDADAQTGHAEVLGMGTRQYEIIGL